jgi:hypothetical protein
MHLLLIDNAVFGKAAIKCVSDDLSVRTHVIVSQAALETLAARPGCCLAGNPIPCSQIFDVSANLNDYPSELVPHDDGGLDRDGNLVMVDVQIGSADPCGLDLYLDLARSRLGLGHHNNRDVALPRSGFNERFHIPTPSRLAFESTVQIVRQSAEAVNRRTGPVRVCTGDTPFDSASALW